VPDLARHSIYKDLIEVYAACEARSLGKGLSEHPVTLPSSVDPVARSRDLER
jgi:hypothetical protein